MATIRRIRKTGGSALPGIESKIEKLKVRAEVEKKRQEFLDTQDKYRKMRVKG